MSASEDHSHESLIKTPKQLVIVLVLAFVVPIIVIGLLAKLATSGRIYDKDSPAMSPQEVAKRIRPVAEVGLGATGPGGKILKTGEEVYRSVCMACHATGISKAPKFGDRRDWARYLREGQKKLAQAAAGKADGKIVYESTCMACHGAGVANAPKFGDKKVWAPHLQRGVSELYATALKGKGAMPPRGGNLTLSEAEVKAAVDHMVSAVK
jgi:cytochrome c5